MDSNCNVDGIYRRPTTFAQLLEAMDRLEQRLNKGRNRWWPIVATPRERISRTLSKREIDFLVRALRYVPRGVNLPSQLSTKRIPLSAGEKSLCLPGGQILTRSKSTQERGRDDLPHVRMCPV